MSEEEGKKRIKVTIDGELYDVTDFEHPGEGICGVHLREYDGQDVTTLMDHHHYTNQPFEIIERAKATGHCHGVFHEKK